jgi:hypothetical protein
MAVIPDMTPHGSHTGYDAARFHRKMSEVSDNPAASFSGCKSELRNVKSGGALKKI